MFTNNKMTFHLLIDLQNFLMKSKGAPPINVVYTTLLIFLTPNRVAWNPGQAEKFAVGRRSSS